MDKIKIKNINTGAIILVKNELASDFIGTGIFEIVKENVNKSEKNIKEEITTKDVINKK